MLLTGPNHNQFAAGFQYPGNIIGEQPGEQHKYPLLTVIKQR